MVLVCTIGLCSAIWVGCSTDTASTAVNAEALAIPTVNAAMTTWSAYVASGKATAAQIATVSNTYSVYYQAQLAASNAASIYVANPSTNLAGVLANLEATALASQTNITTIISTFTK